jgi:hypothetical protein
VTARRIATALAGYLMLLHVVAMGAVAAEPIGLDAGLFVICSAHSGAPDTPAPPDHSSQHAPCALCGLGHCAITSPPAVALSLELAATMVVEVPAAAPAVLSRYVDASRPRGPPLRA